MFLKCEIYSLRQITYKVIKVEIPDKTKIIRPWVKFVLISLIFNYFALDFLTIHFIIQLNLSRKPLMFTEIYNLTVDIYYYFKYWRIYGKYHFSFVLLTGFIMK